MTVKQNHICILIIKYNNSIVISLYSQWKSNQEEVSKWCQ